MTYVKGKFEIAVLMVNGTGTRRFRKIWEILGNLLVLLCKFGVCVI